MPLRIRNFLISLPYNDFDLLEAAFHNHGEELAAVVVEPIMGNVACIMPDRAWLQRVRELCTEYGVVLIFDEVKTGFRLARGGAQEYFGVTRRPGRLRQGDGQRLPRLRHRRPRRHHGRGRTGPRGPRRHLLRQRRGRHGRGRHAGDYRDATSPRNDLRQRPGADRRHRRNPGPARRAHVVSGVPSMFSVLLGKDTPPTDYRSYAEFDADLFGLLAAR